MYAYIAKRLSLKRQFYSIIQISSSRQTLNFLMNLFFIEKG